jgi:hypothetical protein
MTPDELDYGRRLVSETNAIFAKLDSAAVDDAVNWGDLGCIAAERVEVLADDVVNVEWRVIIEEAAPDAYGFRALNLRSLPSAALGGSWW